MLDFERKRLLAVSLAEACGLNPSDVTRLSLTFDSDGSCFVEATVIPRTAPLEALVEQVRRFDLFAVESVASGQEVPVG